MLEFVSLLMLATVAAVAALQKSDLLITLGARFDDRVTGKLESFAPDAKVIHADIDPAEIGKNRHADVPIVGDVRNVITDLLEVLRRDGTNAAALKLDNWWEYLSTIKSTYPLSYGPQSDGSLSPEYVIEKLGQIAGPEALYVAGVGQHQMWAAQFVKYEKPRTWLNSGGLGTMGYAVPAALGPGLRGRQRRRRRRPGCAPARRDGRRGPNRRGRRRRWRSCARAAAG